MTTQPAKQLVHDAGFSVAGLARRIGVDVFHLYGVLNGELVPSHEVRVGLCAALDRPVTDLFTADALVRRPGWKTR